MLGHHSGNSRIFITQSGNQITLFLNNTMRLAGHHNDITRLHLIGRPHEEELFTNIEHEVITVHQLASGNIISLITITGLDCNLAVNGHTAHTRLQLAEHTIHKIHIHIHMCFFLSSLCIYYIINFYKNQMEIIRFRASRSAQLHTWFSLTW